MFFLPQNCRIWSPVSRWLGTPSSPPHPIAGEAATPQSSAPRWRMQPQVRHHGDSESQEDFVTRHRASFFPRSFFHFFLHPFLPSCACCLAPAALHKFSPWPSVIMPGPGQLPTQYPQEPGSPVKAHSADRTTQRTCHPVFSASRSRSGSRSTPRSSSPRPPSSSSARAVTASRSKGGRLCSRLFSGPAGRYGLESRRLLYAGNTFVVPHAECLPGVLGCIGRLNTSHIRRLSGACG